MTVSHKNTRYRISGWTSRISLAVLTALVMVPARAESVVTVIMSDNSAPYLATLTGFQEYLRDIDTHVNYEIFDLTRDPDLADRLSGHSSDQENSQVIYCLGARACQVTQELDLRTPVVGSLLLTPIATSPESQATGVLLNYSPKTQFVWLKKLFPTLRRVGVLFNSQQNQTVIAQAESAAKELGLELVATEVRGPKEIPGALANLLRSVDVLWALPDRITVTVETTRMLMLDSFRHRVSVLGASPNWVNAGALYALDWDYEDVGAQGAAMAVQILEGIPATEIPYAEPRTVTYTLNLKTAVHMKLNVSEETSLGAKNVYQ